MRIQQIRTVLATIGLSISFVVVPYYFDYSDYSWDANSSNYIGFITGVLITISSLVSSRLTKEESEARQGL